MSVSALSLEDRLLEILRGPAQPLFAVLDAARDCRVRALLAESGQEFQSLYEGAQGKELAEVAPYLVRLPAESSLLERLVRDGWGQSWGIYLTCDQSLTETRKHFRRFLLVKTEEGRELYFRFYDPRVMRIFLPTCTRAETDAFFGPVRRFLMEAEEPGTLLQFNSSGPEATVQLERRPVQADAETSMSEGQLPVGKQPPQRR